MLISNTGISPHTDGLYLDNCASAEIIWLATSIAPALFLEFLAIATKCVFPIVPLSNKNVLVDLGKVPFSMFADAELGL